MTHDNDQEQVLDPAVDRQVTDALDALGTVEPPREFVSQVMWRTRHLKVQQAAGRHGRRASEGVVMAKKVLGGLAALAAVGLAAAYLTGFPPTIGSEGTIGAAQRYQAEQIGNNDVKVGDQALQKFMQTDAFDKLIHDKKAMAALASPAFQEVLANPALREALASDSFRDLLADAQVHEILASPALADILASPLVQQALAGQKANDTLNAQALEAILAGPQFDAVLASAQLSESAAAAQLAQALASPALQTALASPAFQAALLSDALQESLASAAFSEALASPAFEALLADAQLTSSLASQQSIGEVLQAAGARVRE